MEDKPYACDMPGCTQRYSNLSNMRRHQRAKHGRKGCRRPPSQAMTLENEPRCPQGAGEVQQLQREVMRGERGSVHDVPVLSSSAVSEADMGPSAPLRRRQHHHHQQMEEEEDTSIPSRPQEMPGRRGGALVFSGEEDGGAALSRVVDHTAALKEAGIDPADVTVLVVDDEPSSRRVAGRFLKSAGYNVLQGAFLSFRPPPPFFFSLLCLGCSSSWFLVPTPVDSLSPNPHPTHTQLTVAGPPSSSCTVCACTWSFLVCPCPRWMASSFSGSSSGLEASIRPSSVRALREYFACLNVLAVLRGGGGCWAQ